MGHSVTINDGLESMATKLGQKSGKRYYTRTRELSQKTLLNLHKSNWIVKKFVEKTAQDTTKKWREIKSNDFNPEDLATFTKEEKRLGIKALAEEAMLWASLLGDVLVLAVTDVPDELYKSRLVLENEEIKRFVVIDRSCFKLGDIDDDVVSGNFGNPIEYIINNELCVHHSRVHRIRAGQRPASEIVKAKFGISDVQAVYEVVRMFDTISTSVSDLTEESKVDVISIEGLNNQIASGQEDDVVKYALIAQDIKSSQNMLLIDSNASYDQKETSFGGLSDIWVKAGNVLAGALDRPITVLFGQSASGFNSGEEDNKNYYDTINALQESRLRPLLDFFDQFIFDLMGKVPNDWWYEFPTLDVMNKSDEATIFNAYATGMGGLVQNSILTEAQVQTELKQRGIVESITDGDCQVECKSAPLIKIGF